MEVAIGPCEIVVPLTSAGGVLLSSIGAAPIEISCLLFFSPHLKHSYLGGRQ